MTRTSPWCRPSGAPCATPSSSSAPTPRPSAARGAPATWRPTSCVREHRPDLASGIWFAPLEGRLERGQAAIAAGDYLALVDTVRSGPPRWSPTRLGRVDALVNTAELVVHHEDALRGDGAVGPRREVPERTSRAVLAVLRRSASLMFRRAEVGVRLVAPGAEPIAHQAARRSSPSPVSRSSCCSSPSAGCRWRTSRSTAPDVEALKQPARRLRLRRRLKRRVTSASCTGLR